MPAELNRPAPGAGVTATWNYTLGSIVFMYVVLDLMILSDLLMRVSTAPSWPVIVLLVLSLASAATRIRYTWFLRNDTALGRPSTAWTIALFAPALLSWGIAFIAPEVVLFAGIQLWFSGVLYACFLTGWARWGLVLGLAVAGALPVIVNRLLGVSLYLQLGGMYRWFVIWCGVMLPVLLFTSLWLWRVVRRLDESRHLAAELAVTQERLRFAADLHDIQGHHLQVIALKAELAERTLAQQPALAAAQIGEIRLIAKEAMEETRALVAGLREVDLRDELENASEVLTLAGAACALDIAATPADPGTARVLAFAVREATTNVLRHSAATRATISLGPDRGGYLLVITNDGVGAAAAVEGGPGSGTGLTGLRDRVAALGGTLDTTLTDGAGTPQFALRVWVPGGGRA